MKKILILIIVLIHSLSGFSQADSSALKAAILSAEQSAITITDAFGDYKFGMTEKEFMKATKLAIKEKKAARNSIGNVEYVMHFEDGRTYSLILANAAFYNGKLCGLNFVFERFDPGISEIIMEEIMHGDRFKDMTRFSKTDGFVYIKDNLQIDLTKGNLSYANLPVVNQKGKENAEKNHASRSAF